MTMTRVCIVKVAVTVQGITLSQIHPVLDARNRPILAPNAFDINTSIQRCLVKAIALHGLGLYIYAGEDLPHASTEAANDSGAGGKPLSPEPRSEDKRTGPTITPQQQVAIQKLVLEVGVDMGRLLQHWGIQRLRDLPAAEFMRVIRSLEKRRAA